MSAPAAEVRHYIGAGYYLLIGQHVELGCDDWPDDEGVLLQHMVPADGLAMAKALGCQKPSHVRPCTCHPDDDPPRPCPRRYALSECRAAAERRP